MSVCTAEAMNIRGNAFKNLIACALLHDNALTQYIQKEFHGGAQSLELLPKFPHLELHCSQVKENIRWKTDRRGVIFTKSSLGMH